MLTRLAPSEFSLCVLAPDTKRLAEASVLAQTLCLPLIEDGQTQGFSYALALTAERLELRTLGRNAPGPVSAELDDGDIRRRVRGGRRQPLARACGIHRDGPLRVLDATAGLGRDGVVLARLGCAVTLIERAPVIAALLRDGLKRLGEPKPSVELLEADAADFMRTGRTRHDVVYLDPMYSPRHKTALARKEMRILRAVAGDDTDAGQLLEAALAYAKSRVVVKRQPHAEVLGDRRPDYQLKAKLVRYDVYLMQASD